MSLTGVLVGHAFTEEDVAEVAVAIFADDFGARAINIADASHGSGDFVIEAGPAAVTLELVG